MQNRTGSRPAWRAGAAMLFIAFIAAVISYNDGLFVARLAGNHDRLAYLYPLLPDGLIVICLIALYEAARARVPRPAWATAGLALGAGLTLAMNVGAGAAHGYLDMVVDGFVPVVFFAAVEVLIWTIRQARSSVPAAVPVAWKPPPHRQVREDYGVGAETARKIRAGMVTAVRAASNGHGGT